MSNANRRNGRKARARGQPIAALRLDRSPLSNERHPLAGRPSSVDAADIAFESPSGDCFVVLNCRGDCWDGDEWVKDWWRAIHFRRPDPAYELCDQAAREAERRTGVVGVVCYIPAGTPASARVAPFPDLSQVDLRDLARSPEVC